MPSVAVYISKVVSVYIRLLLYLMHIDSVVYILSGVWLHVAYQILILIGCVLASGKSGWSSWIPASKLLRKQGRSAREKNHASKEL